MTTDTEAMRQKFERHIVATGRSEGELIFEAGHYLYPDVQEIWELYQAGHAAAKAELTDAGVQIATVQCHGSAEHPLYTVAAERISALCDTLLNRPARNAGLESEYAAEAAAKAADVGEPVAFAHFSENGKISLWLWAPERPRDLDGKAAQPLYTADQLAAAVAAERGKCAVIVNELRMECARRNMPESATMLWHAEDAIRAGAKEPSDADKT